MLQVHIKNLRYSGNSYATITKKKSLQLKDISSFYLFFIADIIPAFVPGLESVIGVLFYIAAACF